MFAAVVVVVVAAVVAAAVVFCCCFCVYVLLFVFIFPGIQDLTFHANCLRIFTPIF